MDSVSVSSDSVSSDSVSSDSISSDSVSSDSELSLNNSSINNNNSSVSTVSSTDEFSISDSDEVACLGAVIAITSINNFNEMQKKRDIKKRRERRWSVRPINRFRKTQGQFVLFQRMKIEDHEQFALYTRMSVNNFNYLLDLLVPKLLKISNREPLSPEHRLAMTLSFLSQGDSLQSVAWSFHVGRTTVQKVIIETCAAIWNVLSSLYIKTPQTEVEWLNIANSFQRKWNFPNCLGAIDGKHIGIQAPKNSGSSYFNYKKNFSIVLMASCDADYRFTYIDCDSFGSASDGGIFRNTLANNSLKIPKPSLLPHSSILFPYTFVADEAFPLSNTIMRPYPGKRLPDDKLVFNYRLSRARRIIENSFGILVSRWRILARNIIGNVENIQEIIRATIALHNFLREKESEVQPSQRRYCPTGYVDENDMDSGLWRRTGATLKSVGRQSTNNAAKSIIEQRDQLKNYFVGEGSVEWQWRSINRE